MDQSSVLADFDITMYNPKSKALMGTSKSVETVSESEVRCEADTHRRLKILPKL
jgi:hypothetical protein